MAWIIKKIIRPQNLRLSQWKHFTRTFLSPTYYCKEAWENRLSQNLLQKINLDTLYFEIDQRFQKSRQISAVDVDIFANALTSDLFVDELLDLVHKLRLSSQTGNTLDSTSHAVIRVLMENGKTRDLLLALDDRLNYGLFLDDYTANILLDHFWKNKNFVAGSMVASQMMLQEDFKHPLTTLLSLIHCYNYLLKPEEWPRQPPPEEPEEEVKVRVKYLRNPFNDNHFDLKDPIKITGKTLAMATKNRDDSLNRSLNLLGLALFGEEESFRRSLEGCVNKNIEIFKETIELIPEDNKFKADFSKLKSKSENIQSLLEEQTRNIVEKVTKDDIKTQCELFRKWDSDRLDALNEQKRKADIAKRLAEIEQLKKNLGYKEQKLWFFENEEIIELGIESKLATLEEEAKEKVVKEEEYIPPEVTHKAN